MDSLKPHCPSGQPNMVHLNSDGLLVWPVLFLYPEFGETDFIAEFNECNCLNDHLNVMFSEEQDPPCWDRERKYKPHTVDIYVELKGKYVLVKIDPQQTLGDILASQKIGYVVSAGTPSFIILLKNSPYQSKFLEKYKVK